jgi:diadenosine tetraphosphate (Ap4A) HIT family hydrolase
MRRVLKPEGTLAIIEHNPYNPVTLLIVSRTPVDADAILLRPDETLRLYREAGLRAEEVRYFLYLPESLFQRFGRIEAMFSKLPLGGQYVAFGRPA